MPEKNALHFIIQDLAKKFAALFIGKMSLITQNPVFEHIGIRPRLKHLHIVIGMVSDKDVSTVLSMLPKDATYYFTQASVHRAMPAERLSEIAHSIFNFKCSIYNDVPSA